MTAPRKPLETPLHPTLNVPKPARKPARKTPAPAKTTPVLTAVKDESGGTTHFVSSPSTLRPTPDVLQIREMIAEELLSHTDAFHMPDDLGHKHAIEKYGAQPTHTEGPRRVIIAATDSQSGYDGLGPGAVANQEGPAPGWFVGLVVVAMLLACLALGYIAGAFGPGWLT